ncbi:MAG: DUF4835 family protein [Calditrichaceae bacterium]
MKFLVYGILITIFSFFTGQAQVLKISVQIEMSHLPTDQQDELIDFPSKIEQYYNNYQWTDDEYETDIDCNIHIIIETIQKKTFEKIYRTQFLISSVSGENFYDKTWEFPYESSFPLNHIKGQFDPLTHFLDFYAYMVLAGEMDTYGLLIGSPLYDKALDIANQGVLSQYPRGWSTRADDLQKITNIRTRPLREVKPDFFEALYLMDQAEYEKAYVSAKKVLEGISRVFDKQPNNRYLRMFFDAHFRELAKLFVGHNDDLQVLVDFDSKHRDTYREFLTE